MKLNELSPAAGSTHKGYRVGRGAGSGNGAERLLCVRGRGGDGYLLADRDGRDILGRNWAIFAHAISYPVLDDLQHSIKFTYWYHQRNRIIYRLNGIKKYWRYCRQ